MKISLYLCLYNYIIQNQAIVAFHIHQYINRQKRYNLRKSIIFFFLFIFIIIILISLYK